ncbi:hypothetical protein VTN00DRAFT_4837 [Thermoascus crustaceus]|uniref:uncharacterized protein n=1 Tax=Thermoascus crustaceus TaxID=5088 RepID=UPI0037448498
MLLLTIDDDTKRRTFLFLWGFPTNRIWQRIFLCLSPICAPELAGIHTRLPLLSEVDQQAERSTLIAVFKGP